MYKIAIGSSERSMCSELETMFLNLQKEFCMSMEIDIFYSEEALRQYLQQKQEVDLMILNLEESFVDGLAIGKFLREEVGNETTKIVYLSFQERHPRQLFEVQTYDCLLKPVTLEQVRRLLIRLTRTMHKEQEFFQSKSGKYIRWTPYKNILYFESDGHKVVAVLPDRKICTYNKLSHLFSGMPENFIMIHKSFIINQDHIRHYSYESVKMSDERILSISRTYRKEVRKRISGVP